jgi:hypothetical protein
MKAAAIAALGLLIVLPAHAGQPNRASNLPTTCDNDGHCTTFNAGVAPIYNNRKKTRTSTAVNTSAKPATTALPVSNPETRTSEATKPTTAVTPAVRNDPEVTTTETAVVTAAPTSAPEKTTYVIKERFQAYINDLEKNYGARVLFMGGIRPGRCLPQSQHPCGKALDVCQLGWGKVDPRCNLPDRVTLGRIAAAHGLFEGGRWCHSDYGHVQTSVTAAACGDGPFRIVRRAAPETFANEARP